MGTLDEAYRRLQSNLIHNDVDDEATPLVDQLSKLSQHDSTRAALLKRRAVRAAPAVPKGDREYAARERVERLLDIEPFVEMAPIRTAGQRSDGTPSGSGVVSRIVAELNQIVQEDEAIVEIDPTAFR